MASFRKNFWAFVGLVVIFTVGGAILCGYLLGLVLRIVVTTLLSYPLSIFLYFVFGKKVEKSDRFGALMLAIPFAVFILVMWLVSLYWR